MDLNRKSLRTDYDLNTYITNDDGNLKWSPEGNYADTCKNYRVVRVVGSNNDVYLVCDCLRIDGTWTTTKLNLDEKISNYNGTIIILVSVDETVKILTASAF